MGCGSSNQIHEINNPTPQEVNNLYASEQDDRSVCSGRCYLFGQSSGEKKVVLFNSKKQIFSTISSRLRIPTPKVRLQPIQILYEESQEVILPDLMKKSPSPPYNYMFGTFCKKDMIFLCGGINYQGEQIYSQSYFYNINPQTTKPKNAISPNNQSNNTRVFIKFQQTASMNYKRYCHMGIYICEREFKNQYVYIFGGKNSKNQSMSSCQRFDLISKKWKQIASMFTPRSEGCAIRFMGNIYVFGGISNLRVYPQNIQVYNPKQDSWNMLNIQLHRGIRSCLITSQKSNEIIIIGGITNIQKQQQKIDSFIKVNLVQQTYIWQCNFPQKISHIKYTNDVEGNKLIVFSNINSMIYSYDAENKKWKNYGIGYKNYIPVIDLNRFSCVAQPLDLKFDREEIKVIQIKQKQQALNKKLRERQQFIISDLFVLGNENYPCVINYIQDKNIIKQELNRLSMKLQLRSNMNICPTPQGYFITGGCDKNHRYSFNGTFIYNPSLIAYKAVEQLPSMAEARHAAASICMDDAVYVFGGVKNHGYVLKSCQKFNLKQKKWQNVCNPMLKGLYNHVVYRLQFDQSKILLLGGKQFNGNPNTLIQIYDTSSKDVKMDVISYQQFPILGEGDIKEIFVRKPTQKQLQQIQVNQQDYLVQTGHLYKKRQEIDKQPKIQPLKTNRSNNSMSPKGKISPSPRFKSPELFQKSPKSDLHPTFKNLIAQNIPESYRKSNLNLDPTPTPNPKNRVRTVQQQYFQKQQQQFKQKNRQIIKLKTQILSIVPKNTEQKLHPKQPAQQIIQKTQRQQKQKEPIQKKKAQTLDIYLDRNKKKQQKQQRRQEEELIQIELDEDDKNNKLCVNDNNLQGKFDKHLNKKQEFELEQIQYKEEPSEMLQYIQDNQEQNIEFMVIDKKSNKLQKKQEESNISLRKSISPHKVQRMKSKQKHKEKAKNPKLQKILAQYQILRIYVYKQQHPQQIQQNKQTPIQKNNSKLIKNKEDLKINLKLQINIQDQKQIKEREISKSTRVANQPLDSNIGNISKTSRITNEQVNKNNSYVSVGASQIINQPLTHSYLQSLIISKINKIQCYNLLINKKSFQMHLLKNKKTNQTNKKSKNQHIIKIPDNIFYTHIFKQKNKNTHYFLNLYPNISCLPNNDSKSDKTMSLYIVNPEADPYESQNKANTLINRIDIDMDERLTNVRGFGQYKAFTVPRQF